MEIKIKIRTLLILLLATLSTFCLATEEEQYVHPIEGALEYLFANKRVSDSNGSIYSESLRKVGKLFKIAKEMEEKEIPPPFEGTWEQPKARLALQNAALEVFPKRFTDKMGANTRDSVFLLLLESESLPGEYFTHATRSKESLRITQNYTDWKRGVAARCSLSKARHPENVFLIEQCLKEWKPNFESPEIKFVLKEIDFSKELFLYKLKYGLHVAYSNTAVFSDDEKLSLKAGQRSKEVLSEFLEEYGKDMREEDAKRTQQELKQLSEYLERKEQELQQPKPSE